MSNIFRTRRPTNVKFGTQTQHEVLASAIKRHDLQVNGQGRKVTWCVWQVLANKSRTKRPRKTKIGRKIVHPTSNNASQIQGQRSKVKVTRPINAETGSASYLPNGKAYELQSWYTDAARRLAWATSAVSFKIKGQGRKVTWCVWQVMADNSRTKHPRSTKIGENGVVHLTGCWEVTCVCGSMKATFSRRRYATVFRAVCDGAPSCCRVHDCTLPLCLASGNRPSPKTSTVIITSYFGAWVDKHNTRLPTFAQIHMSLRNFWWKEFLLNFATRALVFANFSIMLSMSNCWAASRSIANRDSPSTSSSLSCAMVDLR